MAKVQPVEIPFEGVGTTLEVTVLPFKTDALNASTYNRLLSDEGKEVIPSWSYQLTDEQFAAWGQDNSVVDDYVAENKGLVIIGE
ncbi:hypothetical protein UFOVP316_44 [uncultured Caudovirales phage]|uniref:Uncharacterized protein n=1 Tax=uncultured Caudovirales phage TaxID=2100421 RepID=A0A6J5LWK9_9CAUD|nr:hypothetical protein UFOVP316_44 [uncultured Caudovirales phage]